MLRPVGTQRNANYLAITAGAKQRDSLTFSSFPLAKALSTMDVRNRNGWAIMGLRKTKSIQHGGKSVAAILEAHMRFFQGKDGGARADLTGANLSRADLSGANLSGAILRDANLEGTD